MSFVQSFSESLAHYRKMQRDMNKLMKQTSPNEYGQYLESKKRSKKHKRK